MPDSGAGLYTHGMVSSLLQTGAEGAIISYGAAEPGVDCPEGLDVFYAPSPRRPRIFSLLSTLQSDAWRMRSRSLLDLLDQALAREPDLVVIDYFAMGWVLNHLEAKLATMPKRPKLVHVTHNYEKEVRRTVARSSPRFWMRWVMTLDAVKAGWLEDRLVAAADLVTAITDEDRRSYLAASPGKAVITLKPGYDGEIAPTAPITEETPRKVVLVG
ncbi:MAG: glycosyltransferase, partial [Caulobacteraceae bacterium]|nr:glycosyltransferase [Caulobacteraceae bacterium]